MRTETYAAVFYDDFCQGWRFHVWLNFLSIISSSKNASTTPHEAISELEKCVGSIVMQPTNVHYVVYGNYVDYEMDVFQQYLDSLP